jgi:hypothetical protein
MKTLLESKSVAEFLQLWLAQSKAGLRPPSFETLAQRGGFSSRSFVRQVFAGEKPLTAKALPRFLKILRLDKNHEKFLRLLLEKDVPSFNIDGRSRQVIEAELSLLRERISTKQRRRVQSTAVGAVPIKRMALIYPHLSRARGTDLKTLCKHSGLSDQDCQQILDSLVKENFAVQEKHLYFATERLLQIQEPSPTGLVRSHMNAGLELLKEALHKSADLSPEQLFFRAQYSVDPARLAEFKNQLRSLLVEFVETSESDEGKKVGNLICGFF